MVSDFSLKLKVFTHIVCFFRLKSMNSHERLKVFLIDNMKITQIILKMYWKTNETGQKGYAKLPNEGNKSRNLAMNSEL